MRLGEGGMGAVPGGPAERLSMDRGFLGLDLGIIPLALFFGFFVFWPNHVAAQTEDSPGDPVRVLFIGNSYTYYNDLPSMLTTLASSTSGGAQIQAEAVVAGGATLEGHWDEGKAVVEIRKGSWDFVVLQEQSLRPVRDPQKMFVFARKFAAEIRKAGAEPVLFLTWAREGRPEMQGQLNRSYLSLGRELGAEVAPAGPAWRTALNMLPGIPLHMDDGSHPTPTGTYLAACVFLGVLIDHSDPCPPLEDPEISPSDAAVARRAASQVVSPGG